MIYKFKSKAAGDVIMMAPQGDQLLKLIGKTPGAQGIIEVADMPAAVAALEQAVAAAEAARQQGEQEAAVEGRRSVSSETVSLRQRAWPMIDMLKRSHAERAVITWGV